MTGQIYLIDAQQQLVAMRQVPYDSKAVLQQLVADHRSLLAGGQMTSVPARTDAR